MWPVARPTAASPTAIKDCVPFQVNLDMARLAVPGMDLWFNALFGQLEKHRPEGGRFSWNEGREGIGSSGRHYRPLHSGLELPGPKWG